MLSVNWGDGSALSTNILMMLGSLAHTYGEEGGYTVTVTVTDSSGMPGSAMFSVIDADQAVQAMGTNLSGPQGLPFSNVLVATFTDPAGAEPNSSDPNGGIGGHYTASTDWGDNTSSADTISFASGVFSVTGSHTYAMPGIFQVKMMITHEANSAVTANGTALATHEPSAFRRVGSWLAVIGAYKASRKRRLWFG